MSRPLIDYSVYLVTDEKLCEPHGIESVVRRAVAGGVRVVQLREKKASTREFIAKARVVQKVLEGTDAVLLINDRVDVALAVGAHGVHLGQSDMHYLDARRLLGAEAIIGISTETLEQAEEAQGWDVDYLGISPVFDTTTKSDTSPPWGLEGVAELRAYSRHTLVGIGGIGPENASTVIRAGAHGVAVVSAICAAVDPEFAARKLNEAVVAGRE